MTDPAIRTRALTKHFGALTAVNDLTFEVPAGCVFGFLGPNGAGKSTTIRMLTGLTRPSGGSAVVAGWNVDSDPLEVKRRVGYLAETPYLYPKLTGREFLRFLASLHRVERSVAAERIDRLLELLDLSDKADRLVDGYSKGMRQKLGLAGALIHEPQVLFLDEPTSSLDPRSARLVKDLLSGLARKGRTVFLSTHVLEVAQHMCARVAILNRGSLVAEGSLDDLRSRARARDASLEDIFLELTGGPEDRDVVAFLER